MLKLDAYALTDVGRRRDHNEDFLGDLLLRSEGSTGPVQISPSQLGERGRLFAVADGMGGYASGEVASEMAITTLFQRYYNTPLSTDLAGTLAQAVNAANRDVHIAGFSKPGGFMGTTLTLALFKGNRALVGNVGDSRTYLLRQGELRRVTRDHSVVQEQIDLGLLAASDVSKSKVKNVITRAIGHRAEVEADFFEVELEPGDTFLLCSDGLHGPLPETEIPALVSGAAGLQEAAVQLVKQANERGGPDNISVVLVRVLEVGEKIPPFLTPPQRKSSPTDKTDPMLTLIPPPASLNSSANKPTEPIAPLVKESPAADGGSPPLSPAPPKVDRFATTQEVVAPAAGWPSVPPGSPVVPAPAAATPAPAATRTKRNNLLLVALGGSLAGIVIIVGAVLLFLGSQSANKQTVAASLPTIAAPAPTGGSPAAVTVAGAGAVSTSSGSTPNQSNVQRIRLVVLAPNRPFVVVNLFEPGNNKPTRFDFKGQEQSEELRFKVFTFEATLAGKAAAGTYKVSNEAGTFEGNFTLDPFKFDCGARCNFSAQSQLLDNGTTLEIKLSPVAIR